MQRTTLQPIHDNVLVLLDTRKTESTGGIAIPVQAQKAEQWGEVIDVGAKVRELTAGDTALIPAHLGTLYQEGGRDYVIIQESKVLATR